MAKLAAYLRRIWRASLTPDSLLSAEEAAEALPGRVGEMVRWVEENVEPTGHPAGVAVFRWGDVVEALRMPHPSAAEPSSMPPDVPVVGWMAAACVLGVSVDTIGRRRGARNDESEPWWASMEACRAWYAALVAPVPQVPSRSQRRGRAHRTPGVTEGVVRDFHAIIKENDR